MEAHLRNVSKFFEKNANPAASTLRIYYAELSKDVEKHQTIPKSPPMCPYCGIERTAAKHRTRISPGKTPSKSIKNLIERCNDPNRRLPRGLRTLVRKCRRNASNHLKRICSVCSGTEKISLSKPRRRRMLKPPSTVSTEVALPLKKKKKRVRDRTAGLNLSNRSTLKTKEPSDVSNDKHKTSISCKDKNKLTKLKAPTLITKPTKLNISRLKGIMDKNATMSKKSQLQTFLQGLC